jgi:hypothetical protein
MRTRLAATLAAVAATAGIAIGLAGPVSTALADGQSAASPTVTVPAVAKLHRPPMTPNSRIM